jgi:hypothetical protein
MLLDCPACGKPVSAAAAACPHCAHPIRPTPAWRPGIAAVLTLVIPGAGQIYKGQIFGGLLTLIAIVTCYLVFAPLGLLLHIGAIVGAAVTKVR